MKVVRYISFLCLPVVIIFAVPLFSLAEDCPCPTFVVTECVGGVGYCADPDPNETGVDNIGEIQRALDHATDCADGCGGATVEIPAGRFTLIATECQDLLTFGPKVAVRGQGAGVSVLVLEDALDHNDYPCGSGPAILAAVSGADSADDDAQYFHVSGLTFEGNYDGNPPTEGAAYANWQGLKVNSVSKFTVTNCEFTNMLGNGLVILQRAVIDASGVWGSLANGFVDGCYSRDNHGEGFYVHGRQEYNGDHWGVDCQTPVSGYNTIESASKFTFTNNRSEGNDHVGFGIYDAKAVTFVGCVATRNGWYPNSDLVDLKRPGFSADSSRMVSYSGCIGIENFDGFRTAAARHCVPGGSTSYSGCTASDNKRYGFNIVAAEGVAINGCQLNSNLKAGFRIASGCSGKPDILENPSRVANTKYYSLSGGSVSGSINGGLILGADFGTIAGSVMLDLNGHGIAIEDHQMGDCNGEYVSEDLVISGSVIHGREDFYAIREEKLYPTSNDTNKRLFAFFNEVCPTEFGCQSGKPIFFPTCDYCETADNFGNQDTCQ